MRRIGKVRRNLRDEDKWNKVNTLQKIFLLENVKLSQFDSKQYTGVCKTDQAR